MDVNDAKRLKAIEEENRRLKTMVADLSLDKAALQAVIGKSGGARERVAERGRSSWQGFVLFFRQQLTLNAARKHLVLLSSARRRDSMSLTYPQPPVHPVRTNKATQRARAILVPILTSVSVPNSLLAIKSASTDGRLRGGNGLCSRC